jgi:hypothetical protein
MTLSPRPREGFTEPLGSVHPAAAAHSGCHAFGSVTMAVSHVAWLPDARMNHAALTIAVGVAHALAGANTGRHFVDGTRSRTSLQTGLVGAGTPLLAVVLFSRRSWCFCMRRMFARPMCRCHRGTGRVNLCAAVGGHTGRRRKRTRAEHARPSLLAAAGTSVARTACAPCGRVRAPNPRAPGAPAPRSAQASLALCVGGENAPRHARRLSRWPRRRGVTRTACAPRVRCRVRQTRVRYQRCRDTLRQIGRAPCATHCSSCRGSISMAPRSCQLSSVRPLIASLMAAFPVNGSSRPTRTR